MSGWTLIRRRTSLLFACGALSLSLLSGCKQGEGERCQINDDCMDDYYCEYAGNTMTMGGFCKALATSSYDLAGSDFAVQPPRDLSTPDMSVVDM